MIINSAILQGAPQPLEFQQIDDDLWFLEVPCDPVYLSPIRVYASRVSEHEWNVVADLNFAVRDVERYFLEEMKFWGNKHLASDARLFAAQREERP